MGQACSKTTPTVALSPDAIQVIHDVEAWGFVFSDGNGFISPSLAQKVRLRGFEMPLGLRPSQGRSRCVRIARHTGRGKYKDTGMGRVRDRGRGRYKRRRTSPGPGRHRGKGECGGRGTGLSARNLPIPCGPSATAGARPSATAGARPSATAGARPSATAGARPTVCLCFFFGGVDSSRGKHTLHAREEGGGSSRALVTWSCSLNLVVVPGH